MRTHAFRNTSGIPGPPYRVEPSFEFLQGVVVPSALGEHAAHGQDALHNVFGFPCTIANVVNAHAADIIYTLT